MKDSITLDDYGKMFVSHFQKLIDGSKKVNMHGHHIILLIIFALLIHENSTVVNRLAKNLLDFCIKESLILPTNVKNMTIH